MSTVSAILAAALLALQGSAAPKAAPAEKAFSNPAQAMEALKKAVSDGDLPEMLAIFGPSGKKLVASGDDVKDKRDREKFVELANEKVELAQDKKNPNRVTVTLGKDDWPFPVPLVKTGEKWHFSTKDGLREILMRRIGGNELDAIQICRGYVEAQQQYASKPHDESGLHMYAQKIISTPGKQDGLTWYDANGKPAGPIGEAAAKALEEGYTKKTEPYHGYFFKILKSQGPAAPKGKLDYVIQGKMIGGFALVAWPAEYRSTGVKTFIVSHDGIVYEKDLGPETGKVAGAMNAYNPDKTWKEVSEPGD
ncbi:MAG TPA: DUF2950 domain-containing protein [Thermoanaerobaculia bacterium]|nr:DUF2950 domain-containing protein [Thermoanaerobaculia bacterium]